MSETEQHMGRIAAALARVTECEARIAECKQSMAGLKTHIAEAESKMRDAWGEIGGLMAETGEYEVIIPGEGHDIKIGYGPSLESVDVADEDAVPDEFIRLERKPMKKEIREHLKLLRSTGQQFPNWATLTKGNPALQYKFVKKGRA